MLFESVEKRFPFQHLLLVAEVVVVEEVEVEVEHPKPYWQLSGRFGRTSVVE